MELNENEEEDEETSYASLANDRMKEGELLFFSLEFSEVRIPFLYQEKSLSFFLLFSDSPFLLEDVLMKRKQEGRERK